jgi:hypothetical protein
MGARNQVGIGLSYRAASLCSLATLFQTRFLESIPRPIAGLKIQTLVESNIFCEENFANINFRKCREDQGDKMIFNLRNERAPD